MGDYFSAIPEDELQASGMSSIAHGKNLDPDNPIVDALEDSGLPGTDNDGRPIISYRQYKELGRRDSRLDAYALRMRWPGTNKFNTIQASKFLKWWGIGYIPIQIDDEDLKLMSESAKKRFGFLPKRRKEGSLPGERSNGVIIYHCNTKYEDCARFFDTENGLKWHWKRDHGELSKLATRRAKAAEAKEE